jgi:hypothetical protein
MASTKTAGSRKGAGRSSSTLPPVTVAKLEETAYLLERIVEVNQSVFVAKGQSYKDTHRAGSSRPLSPAEAAEVALALDSEDKIAAAEQVQSSTLRAYDEPEAREVLFAAGLGVAAAFVQAIREAVALIEMPKATFEAACTEETLQDAIGAAAAELRNLEIGELRTRAGAAFAHYARSAGFEPGEALGLPVQAVWQALSGAIDSLTSGAASSQLIDSAASTAGTETTSSTASDGSTPSS